MKNILKFGFVVILVLTCVFLVSCGKDGNKSDTTVTIETQPTELVIPWEDGGKAPSEYTWDEFNALTGPQQIVFQNSFESPEDFEKWMNEAQNVTGDNPWDNGGKAPSEYTWDEFNALTGDQQIQFQNSFENADEFEKWMNQAQKKAE